MRTHINRTGLHGAYDSVRGRVCHTIVHVNVRRQSRMNPMQYAISKDSYGACENDPIVDTWIRDGKSPSRPEKTLSSGTWPENYLRKRSDAAWPSMWATPNRKLREDPSGWRLLLTVNRYNVNGNAAPIPFHRQWPKQKQVAGPETQRRDGIPLQTKMPTAVSLVSLLSGFGRNGNAFQTVGETWLVPFLL